MGHSYLESYRVTSTKSIVALIDEMAEQLRGKAVARSTGSTRRCARCISWAVRA
jgi:hypothetical protein